MALGDQSLTSRMISETALWPLIQNGFRASASSPGNSAMLGLAAVLAVLLPPPMARAEPATIAQERIDDAYHLASPATAGPVPSGWGIFVTAKGHSLDLRSRGGGWVDDPRASSSEIEAGLGWRRSCFSAVMGYQQTGGDLGWEAVSDVEPANQPGPREDGDGGVLGLGFILRSR